MYDYDRLLLLLRKMVIAAQVDVRQEHGFTAWDAYLFLFWVERELVPYLEDLSNHERW